jgi:hypothetical protein
MNGLRTTIRCVGATLVLGAVLASPAQADEDGVKRDVRNSLVYGSVGVSYRDGKVDAWASATPNPNGIAAVMKIRLLHRGCGSSSKWKTKAFNASKGGFTNEGESSYTSNVTRTRGLWRASAVLAHKPRHGAPVDWKKKFQTPTWGDCRPLPPEPTASAAQTEEPKKRFSNSLVSGSVGLSERDGRVLAYAILSPRDGGIAAVMKIRLLHRECDSDKWTTKAFNASKGGFTNQGEEATTSRVPRGGRGLFRAAAVFAHKPRHGAPVDWQKKFRTGAWGDCRPLPPPP